jgi:hypothetical protein
MENRSRLVVAGVAGAALVALALGAAPRASEDEARAEAVLTALLREAEIEDADVADRFTVECDPRTDEYDSEYERAAALAVVHTRSGAERDAAIDGFSRALAGDDVYEEGIVRSFDVERDGVTWDVSVEPLGAGFVVEVERAEGDC